MIPRLTVLMPVYNGEKYLPSALESVLQQSYLDFELLVIDDGSTDRTATILQVCAEQDSRIKVHHQVNQGVASSLNNGLNLAQGQYLARMDADDLSVPHRFITQVDFLDRHPEITLVSSNCSLIDEDGQILTSRYLPGGIPPWQIEWELYWSNPIIHSSVMGQTAAFITSGRYPTYRPHAEDYGLWTRMVKKYSMTVLSDPLVSLRKHHENVSRVGNVALIESMLDIARELLLDRQGCSPSANNLGLAMGLSTKKEATSAEINNVIELIQGVFTHYVAIHNLDDNQTAGLRQSLARRWLVIAQYAAALHDRLHLIILSGQSSPVIFTTRWGFKAFIKSLVGSRRLSQLKTR
jgi:glycosyltransferase involved in cell wall biosynthesis